MLPDVFYDAIIHILFVGFSLVFMRFFDNQSYFTIKNHLFLPFCVFNIS